MFRFFSLCCLVTGMGGVPWLLAQDSESSWLAHLSANEQFQSEILLRNDDFDRAVGVTLLFFDSDGGPANVDLRDAAGNDQTVSQIDVVLAPLTTQTLTLLSVSGGDNRSLQTQILKQSGDLVTIEGTFSRFDNGIKTAKLGVAESTPDKVFRINVNRTPDPLSGAVELRGMGITNTHASHPCDCAVSLTDPAGTLLGIQQMSIPARGKWLGLIADLFPDIAGLLNGNGHLEALCSEAVTVQALSFEGTILSTAPVTQFALD